MVVCCERDGQDLLEFALKRNQIAGVLGLDREMGRRRGNDAGERRRVGQDVGGMRQWKEALLISR